MWHRMACLDASIAKGGNRNRTPSATAVVPYFMLREEDSDQRVMLEREGSLSSFDEDKCGLVDPLLFGRAKS